MDKLLSNENYVLSVVAGEQVIVPVSDSVDTLNNLFVLNEMGSFILERLEQGKLLSEILADILNDYEVDSDTASRHLQGFAAELVKKGFYRVG